ncbi:bifunctional DNA primase/polymerase [Kitasatospora purpeofusca]|uniref:bifunctional DNA primase/polymerase n=1 Tax=Kitasatospora purpeofusca TaxID=67352 RepID=UPI00225428EB|nr:bifunctional DNA primase/polymerase [Kitasatospora purpeofusca]MCX4754135.1 bifunctional DNA primase/polymerase [Kitasatospora purpeofusca]WSR33576.1 bifunctional DNA primase/polymerase [Kitasatospora purpeofusca]WSR41660.1 bifunctional DNA primase/polymerase [Kitasatospora purpeofusca]
MRDNPLRDDPRNRSAARAARLAGALSAATEHRWPVVPGTVLLAGGVCSCGDPDCPVPGAHPHDPTLLAATTDARMVRWWWEQRCPDAPVLVATGRTVSAVSLPAAAGARALAYLAALRLRLGPVLAMPDRYAMLVAPYSLDALGEMLVQLPWVPGSLRYHGNGGFLPLPPGGGAGDRVRWVLPPRQGADGGVWLPQVGPLLGELVDAAVQLDSGRSAY